MKVNNLFAHERHDGMQFHVDDVLCPLKRTRFAGGKGKVHYTTVDCVGVLKWMDSERHVLKCTNCHSLFSVAKFGRARKK